MQFSIQMDVLGMPAHTERAYMRQIKSYIYVGIYVIVNIYADIYV